MRLAGVAAVTCLAGQHVWGWTLPAAPAGTRYGSLVQRHAGAKSAFMHSSDIRRSTSSALQLSTRDIEELQDASGLIGEDAAAFSLQEQKLASWISFGGVFTVVMAALWYLWINESTGYGDDFIRALESVSGGNSSVTIVLLLGIFAVAHSGLASLRPKGEEIIGARAWRVLFGVVSLPLALSCLVYFINHRYDGVALWNLKGVPGVHDFCWISSFISFFFLYPSTFNLLEVAAVDKPQLHMWETGVMRITRHPQFVGQGIWCLAHALWVGTSFTLLTSAMLMGHHLFAVWNGDRRLADKYGEAFEKVKARTSVMPFQAVIEGRQKLPADYWKEWARGPYAIIAAGTVGAYYLHPFMQAGSWTLHW
ncbi:NnrU protein-domain-containing protein [Tribonema minus]|uniref:NnrU protein-domain-containing protein n=1 Tax=Tribonema minus TaxID=303371 RepID=A0A835Z2B9_9STRA|nr:NnrU protein-domain-containing protein [Tribonema minus]